MRTVHDSHDIGSPGRRALLAATPVALGVGALAEQPAHGAPEEGSRPRTTVTGFPSLRPRDRDFALVTTADRSLVHALVDTDTEAADVQLDVDPEPVPGRRFEGFGPALTHSAASLLLGMGPARRRALLKEMFSPRGGHRLNALRIPLGTCDFTTRDVSDFPEYYTFADEQGPRTDPLRHFSVWRDERTILPVLREIVQLVPDLTVVASPWTAPAWMKTNGSLIGGSLRDDPNVRSLWADYLVRSVRAYERKVPGLRITALTVQNEPLHDEAEYPCMAMSIDEQAEIIARVRDGLDRHGSDTQVWVYDHNWDHPEYPIEVLDAIDEHTRSRSGVAFHAYDGDASAGTTVHEAHPDTRIWITEQTGTQNPDQTPDEDFAEGLWWMSNTLFLPAFTHHHRGVILFNLVLDQDGGPGPDTFTNGTGLVQLDTGTGELTPNSEFHVMTHFSRFVPPGSRMLPVTTPEDVSAVAARTRGGTVVVLFNDGGSRRVGVRVGERRLSAELPGGSLATFVLGRR